MTCRLIPILLIATLLLLPGCTSLSGLEQVSLVRPPLLDRELFFGDPEISSPELSPDGKYVAFIKPYRDARNIHVKQLDEAFEAATPITADERPVPGYFWSRDGRYVLYVQDKGGNENYHVYAVDPAGEIDPATGVPVARDLTPVDGVRARILSVPRNSPGEIIVGLNDRDPSLHDVYRVDLATGKRELLIENTEKVSSYFFDLEGNARLATRQTPDGSTEFLRVEGSRLTAIYECSYEETCRPYRFHKDGKHLYIVSNKGPDVDLTRMMLMDAKTGRTELVESDPEDQVDFGSASLSAATDELLATVYVGDRVRIYPQDDDLELLYRSRPELPVEHLSPAAPRVLAFLEVRSSLMGLCDEFDAAQGTFHSVDALDVEELPSAGEIAGTTRGFAGTAVEISPLIGRFFKQRNLALLEAGIGLGEYSYIYALAYREQFLDESIEEPLFAQGGPISPEVSEALRAILAHQVDLLGQGAEADTRRRGLDAEILAMERDPRRSPWRNGLPPAVEASLQPYREQLDAAFCLSNAGIDMDPGSRRAFYIALY